MSFIDRSYGWVVGLIEAGGQYFVRNALWSTDDGGKTWREVSASANGAAMPPPNSAVPSTGRLLFATQQDGWLYGLTLNVTHDGGHTWTQTPVPGTVLSLNYVDGTAWALVELSCLLRCSYALLESGDLGRSWAAVPKQPVIVGHAPELLRAGSGRAWIFSGVGQRTRDGGASWEAVPLPQECPEEAPDSHTYHFAASYADGVLWLKCSLVAGAGSERRLFFQSHDDGDSWTLVGTGGIGYSGPIVAFSATRLAMCGGRMPVMVTDDTTRTWQNSPDPPGGLGCGDLIFVDPLHGWAEMGFDEVWRTEDGGAHWQRHVFP